ncbi:hypothetical protein IIB49_02665 [Patescibacteria group bacterium]|nr:hypothetical protein [Patescibacteria group bacterium]
MNEFQGTIISTSNRLKRRNEISHFSIKRDNPYIRIKMDLPQGKSKEVTFNVATSKVDFDEVRKVINQKLH